MPLPHERTGKVGSPFPPKTKEGKIIGSYGDIENDAGARVILWGDQVMFVGNFGGDEMIIGIPIEHFLEQLMEYNKEIGN